MTTKTLRTRCIDRKFRVKIDEDMLGSLSVSEGGLLWRPRHGTKKRGIEISWSEIADWAES